MSYAGRTDVPIERSQQDIERLLKQQGAGRFFRGEDEGRVVIACDLKDRKLMFELPLPDPATTRSEEKRERIMRAKWRALLLCIKAKFVSIESGVESFEDAFLAQLIVPTEDGRSARFGRIASAAIKEAYEKGKVPNFGFAGLLSDGKP